jgi:murein L,D-transpeptidase YafK
MREQFHKYPPKTLFIRAFKQERELEIWAGARKLRLIKTYPILAASGVLGPKLQRGDRQVPEGWYHINRFNPRSRFHLSLGINYPNDADRIRSAGRDPGDDIFIHGSNKSIGCLAMGDLAIEEIYGLACDMKSRIQVLILPSREIKAKTILDSQLKAINNSFESKHFLPKVRITQAGAYEVTP